MSANSTIPLRCESCGAPSLMPSSQNGSSGRVCVQCSLIAAPLETPFTPTTRPGDTRAVQAILLPAGHTSPAHVTVNINIHFEPGRTYWIPDMQELGKPNELFFIPITKNLAGQPLNFPYQAWFQTKHQNRPNLCVSRLTNNQSEYGWFGDIVVLKYDGMRRDRYKSVSSTLTDDISYITHFFVTETILNQARV